MDPTFRYRFLGDPSSTSSTSSSPDADGNGNGNGHGDELNEDDILWTSDYPTTEENITAANKPNNSAAEGGQRNSSRGSSFPKNSGILAALPESNRPPVLYRKTSIPSATTTAKAIPLLPRPLPEREYSASMPAAGRKMNQSAPMNVPVLSTAMAKQRNSRFKEQDYDLDGDEEMLPPHEIVARGSRQSPKTTFSVLEGVGRTLKGRDLRRVRNAVWHQTGFLD